MFNPGNNTKNADLNPAKYPSLAKNPPKYTTAYIVQQRNCRWHCEPTFFLGWVLTMIIYIYSHPPSQISPSPISPSLVFPLQTLRLLSLVSLMTKTKRMIVDNLFRWFQNSGTKVEGILLFVPLRRFYAVLFVPLFCRNAGQCEKRPDGIT